MSDFQGMPVIRNGDNVFIINSFDFNPLSVKRMEQRVEQFGMTLHNYDCPFSILDEFDQWWEWHHRLRFNKQDTGSIAYVMNLDPERMEPFKRAPAFAFKFRHDVHPAVRNPLVNPTTFS